MSPGARDSTDTGVSSSRGTLVSPGGSIRGGNNQRTNTNGSRYSVQEKSHRQRAQESQERQASIRSTKVTNEHYHEINHNKFVNGGLVNGNGVGNGHVNTNMNGIGSVRERYPNPTLVAIINEAQGMKFRGEFI